MVRDTIKSTVPYAELRKLMSAEKEAEFLKRVERYVAKKGYECRNQNVQIRIISYYSYEQNKYCDYRVTFNFIVNFAIVAAIGEKAFREFSGRYAGKRLNIWFPDPDVVDRKERNKAIINDYLGGETSYAELALRYDTSKDNVRQIICRYKKKHEA